MNFLNSIEMRDVSDVFVDAYSHVLSNYTGQDKTDLLVFIAGLVMGEKPYVLVTEEGIQRAIGMVFSFENRRDFVWSLNYVFFSRWGVTPDRYDGLITNLANGICLGGDEPSQYCAIPTAVKDRTASFNDIRQLLLVNRWIVVLLLLQLSVSLSPQEIIAATNQKQ